MYWRWQGGKEFGMKCPIESHDNAALLLDYCARKLDPGVVAVLERHIGICPACQAFRARQQLVWAALDQWEAMPVSRDFDRRLYARIEQEGAAQWWSRWAPSLSPLGWKPAVSAAAAGLILLAAALLRTPDPAGTPEAGAQTRIETVQVDQMERALEDLEMLRQFDLLVAAADGQNSGSI
jgi:hypothetical protein